MRKYLHKYVSVAIAVLFCLSFMASCTKKKPETGDTTAPVITVTDVPASGYMGRPVTVPAATAVDETDGDLTDSVKVDVNGLKANGDVGRQLLYKASANKPNVFTPVVAFTKYQIVYYVSDAAGNKAEKTFDYTTESDTQAPVITITQEGFDVNAGITGGDLTGFVLPQATGIDQPGDLDITANIKATIKNGEDVVGVYPYSQAPLYLIAGSYTVEYSLIDGAENAAQKISFPLTVAADDKSGLNLLNGKFNGATMVVGKDARFNEYAELEIGKKAANGDSDMSVATFRTMKLGEEILGVTLNIDPYPGASMGAESFFAINYIYSKNNHRYTPDGTEGSWSSSVQLQIEASRNVVMSVGGDAKTAGGNNFNTVPLRDGRDHTLYFKFEREGESSTALGAKLHFKVWMDVSPTEEPSLDATMIRSDKNAEGGEVLAEDFDAMWEDPAGYLSFASYSPAKDPNTGKFHDDVMRVKAIAVYDKDASAFDTDITAPVIEVEAPETRYVEGTQITFAEATVTDNVDTGLTCRMYVVGPDGARTDIGDDRAFHSDVRGQYRLTYVVNDANGNVAYREFKFKISKDDNEPPVITLSSEQAIEAQVGVTFNLPVATVIDNEDGDISSLVKLQVVGPDSAENLFETGVQIEHTLYAVGTYQLIYSVMDESQNLATKVVTVNVTGAKTGDLIGSFNGYNGDTKSVSLSSANTVYRGQKIYGEKVSMVLKMGNNEGLLFIQLRGTLASNLDWPNGYILDFNSGEKITVRAGGINSFPFGQFANPFADPKNLRQNVKFEYQLVQETYAGTEYMRLRVWFCEEELDPITLFSNSMNAAQMNEMEGVEVTGGGLFWKVADIPNEFAANTRATFPHIATMNGRNLEIFEYRIDGSPCVTEWSKPTEVLGFEMPTISAEDMVSNIPEGGTIVTTAGDAGVKQIATGLSQAASTENSVTLQSVTMGFQFAPKTAGEAPSQANSAWIKLLGKPHTGQWDTAGMTLRFYAGASGQREIAIEIGTTQMAWIYEDYAKGIYKAWEAGEKIYVNYTITYLQDSKGNAASVQLKLLFGFENEAGDVVWENADIYYASEGAQLGEVNPGTEYSNTLILPMDKFADKDAYTSYGISAMIRGDSATGADNANFTLNYFKAIAETVAVN